MTAMDHYADEFRDPRNWVEDDDETPDLTGEDSSTVLDVEQLERLRRGEG